MREIVHLQTGQCGNQIGTKVNIKKKTWIYTNHVDVICILYRCSGFALRQELP